MVLGICHCSVKLMQSLLRRDSPLVNLYVKVARPCAEESAHRTSRREALPCVMQGTDDETWSPATIFVVSDHLHHLLVRNMFRRDPTPGAAGFCGCHGLFAPACQTLECSSSQPVYEIDQGHASCAYAVGWRVLQGML
jgi:hypothetical protein